MLIQQQTPNFELRRALPVEFPHSYENIPHPVHGHPIRTAPHGIPLSLSPHHEMPFAVDDMPHRIMEEGVPLDSMFLH